MKNFHQKKIKYFDTQANESYTPYVLETSIGLDRMFLAVFSKSLKEEKLDDGSFRTVLKFPKILAPKKVAVLPLLKKDGLPELSKKNIRRIQMGL
jgi:glycyl-tRNA synthetase